MPIQTERLDIKVRENGRMGDGVTDAGTRGRGEGASGRMGVKASGKWKGYSAIVIASDQRERGDLSKLRLLWS